MNSEVSFSPAIQGLLISLNAEYEISNEAISYVSTFAETLIAKLTRTACEEGGRRKEDPSLPHARIIASAEVERALRKVLPADLSRQATSEASQALNEQRGAEEREEENEEEEEIKDVISEFEIIGSPGAGSSNARRSIFFSPDLITKYLSQKELLSADTQLDNTGAIFLSSSLEYVISRLLADVGRKSHPMLSRQACESVFEEGETFYHVGLNMQDQPRQDDISSDMMDDIDAELEDFISSSPLDEDFVPSPPSTPPPVFSDDSSISDSVSEMSDSAPETSDAAPETSDSLPEAGDDAAPETNDTVSETIDPAPETSDPAPGINDYVPEIQPDGEEFLLPEPQLGVPTFVAPLLMLLGQACSGFDATARGIQMMSSLTEYLIRFIVVESARAALRRSSREVTPDDVQSALCLALPEDLAREVSAYAHTRMQEQSPLHDRMHVLVHTAAKLVHPTWDVAFQPGADVRVTHALVYIVRQVMVVAASFARSSSLWTIRACDVCQAAESVLATSSPVWKAVAAAKQRTFNEIFPLPLSATISSLYSSTEGVLLSPSRPPRVYAASKIYLTSIINETPLQPDNQLLIMFLLLASLSLRAIIVA